MKYISYARIYPCSNQWFCTPINRFLRLRQIINGRIKLPYVEPGWYIVTETIPAQGYQKPTNPVTRIYLNPGDNSYLKDDNIAGGGGTGGTGGGTTTDGIEITSGNDYEVVDGIVNYPLRFLKKIA